jgi:heat shock protein HslJ
MDDAPGIDPELGPFKKWVLMSYRDREGRMSLTIAGSTPDLLFFAEGRIAGSGGCNRLMASCSFVGKKVRIGPVASTLMYCGDPPQLMDQEADYFKCLSSADSYAVEGKTLLMYDEGGRPLLKFYLDPDYP